MRKSFSFFRELFSLLIVGCLFFSCSDNLENADGAKQSLPIIEKMAFLSSDNSLNLIEDAECEVLGDSVISCWIRYLLPNKKLVVRINATGEVFCNGVKVISGETIIDYSRPQVFEVKRSDIFKKYTVYVHAFTGLPVMWVDTDDRKDIVSKEEYLKAHLRLEEDVVTSSAGDVLEEDVFIKGRGNSSWEMPKKGYRLKFEKKVSLLNEPSDKSWVLIPNYSDKTCLRNSLAFYMGQNSQLDYTPRSHFVELMLNGRYNGLYLLSEKIKVSKDRVNVGDDGYILEIDFRAENESDAVFFKVPHIVNGICIKEPDVQKGDNRYNYIKEFISEVDSVLFDDNFKDPVNGWQKYLDVNSFVDWYIINEISKNTDARQTSSIYLNFKQNGKLKMGPIWDFDLAFGNCAYRYEAEGFWIKEGQWYSRLFEDEYFVGKVKERFHLFYENRHNYLEFINEKANYIKYSIEENDKKWGVLYNYTWINSDIWGSYCNEIQLFKEWLSKRLEWMNGAIEEL